MFKLNKMARYLFNTKKDIIMNLLIKIIVNITIKKINKDDLYNI